MPGAWRSLANGFRPGSKCGLYSPVDGGPVLDAESRAGGEKATWRGFSSWLAAAGRQEGGGMAPRGAPSVGPGLGVAPSSAFWSTKSAENWAVQVHGPTP
ncbi:hypothetical protein N7507_003529 [Penicillium longicatenatum]|nr:hypothetical protein N7507_003529 [Penicillium longicatenatum]